MKTKFYLKNLSFEEIENAVKISKSFSETLRNLGSKNKSNSLKALRKYIKDNKIDISHFSKIRNRKDYENNPIYCLYCGKPIPFDRKERKFCDSSCAAKYNNAHKTTGTRRSKLECYIEEVLLGKFSFISFEFNKHSAIGNELDIFIPSLSLAFEINGIFHYKPIYGEEKLKQTIEMDKKKIEQCDINGIRLVTIDVSEQTKFTKESSQKYLDIIINEIEQSLKLFDTKENNTTPNP